MAIMNSTDLPGAPDPGAKARGIWIRLTWGLGILFALVGLVGVGQRLLLGHLPAGYGSYVPWGLWVALYFHGVGIAGGAFVVGALGYLLDLPDFRRPATLRLVITLSLAAIFPAFAGIWLDLGHMERAARIFLSPSFTSMMAFNAWMYNAFIATVIAAWFLSFRKQSEWLKPLLCLALLFSIVFPSQSGAFFGVVDSKAYWHSALLPMLFLVSALTAGSSTLLVVRGLLGPSRDDVQGSDYLYSLGRLRLAALVGTVVYFVFEFAEFSIAFWNPTSHAPAIELVLFGPYAWVFWCVHLVLGGLIPLILLARQSPRGWLAGGLLLAVTFLSARLNVLIPGQAVGELKGLQEAFTHPRLTYIYHATLMEYLVGLFLVALGMGIFYAGHNLAALKEKRAGQLG